MRGPDEPVMLALANEITRLSALNESTRIEAAREGWFRALVSYVDLSAEDNPSFKAEADRRWPTPPEQD